MTSRLSYVGDAILGRADCTWVRNGGVCDRAATVHAWLTIVPEPAAAALCPEHWASTLQLGHRPIDFHAFGDHCNLPDAKWFNSTRIARGTCVLPDDPIAAVERFANQPEGART